MITMNPVQKYVTLSWQCRLGTWDKHITDHKQQQFIYAIFSSSTFNYPGLYSINGTCINICIENWCNDNDRRRLKHSKKSLCQYHCHPSQTPCGLSWHQTLAPVVKSQQPTTWTMTQPSGNSPKVIQHQPFVTIKYGNRGQTVQGVSNVLQPFCWRSATWDVLECMIFTWKWYCRKCNNKKPGQSVCLSLSYNVSLMGNV